MLLNKFAFFFLMIILISCKSSDLSQKYYPGNFEIKGVSFVGMHYKNEISYIEKLKDFKISWISQMPFAFQEMNDPEIQFNFEQQCILIVVAVCEAYSSAKHKWLILNAL